VADLTMVVGATQPSIFATLTKSTDGAIQDLTSATGVDFVMRLLIDRRFSVDAPATIISPTAGTVRYDWAVGDLSDAGDFEMRWRITWSDTTVEYSDPINTITVEAA
jgi:hypothetical protein